MAKFPFTLESWLKDKSQKVETRDGRSARIICIDAKADDGACIIALIPGYGGEEAYQFFPNGKAFSSKSSVEDCADLFLITPEPELSEFEDRLRVICEDAVRESRLFPERTSEDFAKKHSAELLDLARKELCESGEVTDWYAKGKADAFKEIEQDPESSYAFKRGFEYGKEEALKDLPRWRKWGNGACGNGQGVSIAIVKRWLNGYKLVDALGVQGEQYIMLSDLEKLPGFKEE